MRHALFGLAAAVGAVAAALAGWIWLTGLAGDAVGYEAPEEDPPWDELQEVWF